MTPAGFPHSDIPGSQPACGSPRLIAACYVLRRRSAPRHPPTTLTSLTTRNPKNACCQPGYPIELSKTVSRTRRSSPLPAAADNREDRRLVEQIGFEPTTSALQGRRSPN
jgi:hypothetical protein